MKNDRYLKFILTVIALCLLWVCFREIPLTPKLHADSLNNPSSNVDVRIVWTTTTAFYMAEPIEVEIKNIAELCEQIIAIKQKN